MCFVFPRYQEQVLHHFWVLDNLYSVLKTVAALSYKIWCDGLLIFGSVGDRWRSCLGEKTTSLVIILQKWLYHNWFDQSCIPSALSCYIFWISLGKRRNSIKRSLCQCLSESVHCLWFKAWLIWYKFRQLSI